MTEPNSIFLTGANGFIGKNLTEILIKNNYKLTVGVRAGSGSFPETVKQCTGMELRNEINLLQFLKGIDVVIHLAARAHVLKEDEKNPLAEFRKINSEAVSKIARQAAESGVKRFILISSIGVNGNQNVIPYTELDDASPQEPYAITKYEAEQSLISIAKETGMEYVIIRPPLVYGPGAPGNFNALIKLISKNVPLPFMTIPNKRSLIALENLTDFIRLCIDHPKAANEIFLISDGENVSITELIEKIAHAMGKKPILIPVPESLLKLALKLFGKGELANRLLGSLQVDSSKARDLLGWQPIIAMEEQLKKTADAYLNEKTI